MEWNLICEWRIMISESEENGSEKGEKINIAQKGLCISLAWWEIYEVKEWWLDASGISVWRLGDEGMLNDQWENFIVIVNGLIEQVLSVRCRAEMFTDECRIPGIFSVECLKL